MAVNLYGAALTVGQVSEYWTKAEQARTTDIENVRAEIFSYMQDYVNPIVLKQFQDDQGNFIVDSELPLLETDTPVVRDLKVMLNTLYLVDYANDSSIATKLTAFYKNAGGFEGAGAGKQVQAELTNAYEGMSTQAFTRFEAMKAHFSEGTGLDVKKLQVLAKNQARLLGDEEEASDKEIEARMAQMRKDFYNALTPEIRNHLGALKAKGLYALDGKDESQVRNAKVMLNLMVKAPSIYEAGEQFHHRKKTGPMLERKIRKARHGLPMMIQMLGMKKQVEGMHQAPLEKSMMDVQKQIDALIVEELCQLDELETNLGLKQGALLQEAEREVVSKTGLPSYYHDALSQRRQEHQKRNESQIKDVSQKLVKSELSVAIFEKNQRFYSVSASEAQTILGQLGDKADPKYKALLENRAKNQESWARWAWNKVPVVSPVTYSEEDYLHGQAAETIQQMLREQQQDLAILNQKQAILEEKMRGEVNQPQPNATLFQYQYLEHRAESLRARIELLESEDAHREEEQDSFMAYNDMITGHDSINLNESAIKVLQEKVDYCENRMAELKAGIADQQSLNIRSISDEKLEVESNASHVNKAHAEVEPEAQVSPPASKNFFTALFNKFSDFIKGVLDDVKHLESGSFADNVAKKMTKLPISHNPVQKWKEEKEASRQKKKNVFAGENKETNEEICPANANEEATNSVKRASRSVSKIRHGTSS